MKSVHLMNYKELFDNFRIILNMKYINNIITDDNVLKIFYQTYPKDGSDFEQSTFMRMFFGKYSKYIDNEAYVFFTLKSLREENVGRARDFSAEVEKRCIEALRGSNYTYFETNPTAKKVGDEVRMVRASDLTKEFRKSKDSENRQRVEELDEKLNLRNLFTLHSTNEMANEYCLNHDLATLITKLGIINAVSEHKELSMRDRMRLLNDNNGNELSNIVDEVKDKLQTSSMVAFYERIPEFLRKYPEYFDLDKILIIAAARLYEYLETAKVTDEENKEFSAALLIIRDSIKSKSIKVENLVRNDGTNGYNYSYKELCEACDRINDDGKYLSRTDDMMIRDELEINPASLVNTDVSDLKIMKLKKDELDLLVQTEGNLVFLIENGLLTEDRFRKMLYSVNVSEKDFVDLMRKDLLSNRTIRVYLNNNNIIGEELFEVLNEKQFLSGDEKFNYYMDGRIELSCIEKMNEEDIEEFKKFLSPEKLIELYRDPEKVAEYLRYSAAYREFIIKGKSKEERNDIGEQIIEAINGDLEDEDFIKFYEQYLITLTTLESWTGSYLVTRLMREAKLRPADVKEICKNGNYDSVLAIMKDPLIPRNNKLAIYRTTFTDDKYLSLTEEEKLLKEEAKEEALNALNLRESRIPNTGKSGTTRVVRGPGRKRTEYVSEPLNRWNLIELLDKDYSYEMLDSGMMIFKLPNVQGGLIILEKMYRNGKPDYARATKVIKMTIEDFEKIKSDLIVDGDITSSAVDSHPALNQKCDSIWHTQAWGQRIAELAGYRTDPRRTKENIKDVDKEIDNIKRSRRLRE